MSCKKNYVERPPRYRRTQINERNHEVMIRRLIAASVTLTATIAVAFTATGTAQARALSHDRQASHTVVAASSLLASPRSARPLLRTLPPDPDTHWRLDDLKRALIGQTVGPAVSTRGGQAKIVKWVASGKYSFRQLTMSRPNVLSVGGRQHPNAIYPQSWWNPGSWDWGSILGSVWDGLWNKCAKGALTGVVGNASGSVIRKLVVRGARVYVGWQGYAVLAISGCVVNLLHAG
ncbi:hypothetical protein M6D93_01725 [Jatrophihabitans telluris]|uniref:Uncharacterized protein n=1 Tax=Jatrophihabitans telluris TaxID=2038343 RepID=A0ABY4R108_9ACTN|nr:hypothetical protein [Jatrophihabitans telluris]UQX88734.1 hypothetical protein M6D93_01725 [Jatrophihabitans telluris]